MKAFLDVLDAKGVLRSALQSLARIDPAAANRMAEDIAQSVVGEFGFSAIEAEIVNLADRKAEKNASEPVASNDLDGFVAGADVDGIKSPPAEAELVRAGTLPPILSSSTGSEFDYVSLLFLDMRGDEGATRTELEDLHKALNLDTNNAEAFRTRLRSRLKGTTECPKNLVEWNKGKSNALVRITPSGKVELEQLSKCGKDTELRPSQRDFLAPQIKAFFDKLTASGQAN